MNQSATPQKMTNFTPEEDREYRRKMLRSSFMSLFWNAINVRKRAKGYKLQDLANALNKDKSVVSKWFSREPNWTIDTIADIAASLDLKIKIYAIDRSGRHIITPSDVVHVHTTTQPNLTSTENRSLAETGELRIVLGTMRRTSTEKVPAPL